MGSQQTSSMAPRSTLVPDLALMCVAVMWGGSYLAAQVMTHVAPPAAVLAMRFLPSLAVLAVAAVVRRSRFTRHIVRVGLVLGLWQAVTLLLETTAVSRTSATNAGVLVCLAVVIGPALEGGLARRRLPGRYFVAAAVGLVGVAMLLGPHGLTSPRLGDLLVLCAACPHDDVVPQLAASRRATCAVVWCCRSTPDTVGA